MALPDFPTEQVAFVKTLNGNAYNASTNAGGMAQGGHRQNWAPGMNDMGDICQYIGDAADAVQTLADQTATDAASAAAGSGTEATVANIRAGTSAQYLSIRNVYSANAEVALTFNATSTAWDMSAGINFGLTLTGNTAKIANPTNKESGKSGVLFIAQDATGGHDITAWDTDYVWIGYKPAIPTVANAILMVTYFVRSSGQVVLVAGGISQ